MKNRSFKKEKILITGGGGMVGQHLLPFLKKKKYKIYILSCRKFYNLSNCKIFKNILIKYKPDTIIHLAARTVPSIKTKKEDRLQYENTFLPVKNLVDSLKYVPELKKIIFFGSIEEYGLARPPFFERQKPKPVSSYGIAKLNSLKYVQNKITNKNKINYIWLRPSLLFGTNQNKKRFLGTLFYGLKFNKKIRVSMNSQIRDYLYIDDLCVFIELLMKKKVIKIKGNVLNVTSENWIKLNYNFFSYFNKIIQKKLNKLVINCSNKKHLNYYSSGHLFRKNFKKFKFTEFLKAINLTLDSAIN
jgi:nucleoside-diphosphate-sugar epimerase